MEKEVVALVKITRDVRKRLNIIKAKKEFLTQNGTIEYLINFYEQTSKDQSE